MTFPKIIGRYHPECDFEEDFQYENGNYYHNCTRCGKEFVGFKRRTICKKCQNSFMNRLYNFINAFRFKHKLFTKKEKEIINDLYKPRDTDVL